MNKLSYSHRSRDNGERYYRIEGLISESAIRALGRPVRIAGIRPFAANILPAIISIGGGASGVIIDGDGEKNNG